MPPNSETPSSCPRCGRPLRKAHAQGLCPWCVGQIAFAPKIATPPNLPGPLGMSRVLGDYELVEELARGGMGVVYRARQISLDREVAVKVMLHGLLASADDVERFRAEAATAAGLKHPGIIAIHEVGEIEGQYYFSMDLVAGRDLSSLTREGPLPVRQAAEVVAQISDAVQHAHDHGVLHRDLKPSNIILDAAGRPHVTDFGLARRAGAQNSLTQTGQMLGTPGYMSPEQASGKRAIGPGADIYSLGALLYHLLTGRAPFTGETPSAILRQVEEREPVAPRSLNPTTPADLETICLKCLRKEPLRRYATARELSEDLARFLHHEPIRARPASPLEHGWRWCRRRPALAAALAGIALLLVAITATSTLSARRIDYLRREAYTNLYAADMRLAQQAVAESKFGVAVDLLERHRPKSGEPDLRQFEWYYFWDKCRSDEAATLGRHPAQAQRAAFSPDGRLAATAAADVMVWDVGSRRLVHHFTSQGYVWSVAFSADGRRLAAAFQDVALFCYDVDKGHQIAALTNPGIQPLALAWNNDNRWLNVFGSGQSLAWDTDKGTVVKTNGLGKGIARLALAPEAGIAVALSRTFDLSVWDMRKVCQLGELKLPAPIRSLAISPDGRRIVTGDYAGNLTVRQISKLQESRELSDHRGMIATVVFSPDGNLLATGGVDQLIHLWDTATWTRVNTLRGHRSVIFAIAFSPNARWLISADKTGEVKLWNSLTNTSDEVTSGSSGGALAADGSVLAFVNANGVPVIRVLAEHAAQAMDFPANQALRGLPMLVSTNNAVMQDGQAPASLILLRDTKQHTDMPECAPGSIRLLSPNGQYLIYSAPGSRLQTVWETVERRQLCQITDAPEGTSPAAIAVDNHRVALRSPNGQVYVFDLRDGKKLTQFPAHEGWCYACDFSTDCHRLVTAGFDGLVKLWEADTGKRLAEFRSSADAYWSVALSPDGRRVAAGTGESTIVLWDVASQQEVASLALEGPLLPVEGQLHFTPDGSALTFAGPTRWQVWRAPALPKKATGASRQ